MKIIKIFGIVAGIHFFALILIFANPGCSSTAKQDNASSEESQPSDQANSQPPLIAPGSNNLAPTSVTNSDTAINFGGPVAVDANARYSPTRPNTPASTALELQPVEDVTPVSTYTVVKGDSFWTIAKKNNLSVGELTSANNLKSNATLRVGQKLVIPGKSVSQGVSPVSDPVQASAPSREPVRAPVASATTHVVKAGETLGAIARRYQVRMGDIATANNISDPAKLRLGQELKIPGAKGNAAASTPPITVSAPATLPAPATTAPVLTGPASGVPSTSISVPTIIISDTPQTGPASMIPVTSGSSEQPPVIKVQETPQN